MSKLFLLTLGGSGERVMKSFVMQLASGLVLTDQNDQRMDVQPIFLDTDAESKALTDALAYIDEYKRLYGLHSGLSNTFHGGAVMPMFSTNVLDPITITIDGAALGCLRTIYEIDNFDPDKKAEMDMLYNDRAQNVDLHQGFIGMPNIGTIALNHLLGDLDRITNDMTDDDKIYFVNSIFGGTGAAGFPLILNKLQQQLHLASPNNEKTLGCLTVLPYFSFNANLRGEARIGGFTVDAGEFDSKTYAAFLYYNKHLHKDGISAQYFVGTNDRSQYSKCLGGSSQDNPAHIIEYIAATSIFHFAKNAKPRNANNTNVKYFEYWFGEGKDCQYNLNDIPELEYKKALVRLQLFEFLMQNELKAYVKDNHGVFANRYSYCVNGQLTSCEILINSHKKFFDYFDNWKNELNSDRHTASMKFKFFNGNPGNNEQITERFEPQINTTHRVGIFNRRDVVTDPNFLGKMSSSVGNLASNGWPERKKNEFTLYLVLQCIEKVLNDNSNTACINLI